MVAIIAAAAGVLATAAPAFAAANTSTPTLANWGVSKSCPSGTSGQNCAVIRATAENPARHILFAAGDFTAAVSNTGTSQLPYNDLVPIDETTGAVVSSFAPHKFNGRINAVAVDPSTNRVYVGGLFTKIDGSGVHAQHAAAFDATTGKLLSFNARANATVSALLVGSGVLYLGGQFTAVGTTPRSMLAAVDPATGAVVPGFVPPTIAWLAGTNSADVRTLALGKNSTGAPALYVGGHFDTVGGAAHMSVARVDATTGTLDSTFAPTLNYTANDPLQAADGIAWVDGSQDGRPGIVVAQAGHTNRGYRFDIAGHAVWRLTPDGDMQAVALSGNTVYFGGHFTCVATAPASCYSPGGGVPRVHIAAVSLNTGAVDSSFVPAMNPTTAPYYYGVWSVEITADGTLWAGGVFIRVYDGTNTYQRAKLAAFPAVSAAR